MLLLLLQMHPLLHLHLLLQQQVAVRALVPCQTLLPLACGIAVAARSARAAVWLWLGRQQYGFAERLWHLNPARFHRAATFGCCSHVRATAEG